MTRLASWADYGTHDESAYPELWRGCIGAFAPCLGPTGLRLHDLSRYRNWGTLTNMDAATDWVVSGGRYALDFDAVDDRIVISSSFEPQRITISCFVNTTKLGAVGSGATILDKPRSVGSAFLLSVGSRGLLNAPGRPCFEFFNGSAWVGLVSSTNIASTGWRHLVGTYDGSTVQLFLDGALDSSASVSGSIAYTGNSTLEIGRYVGNNDNVFLGLLDDVRLYSRVIPFAETRLLSMRRGIAYERRKRRQVYFDGAFFNPAWARNTNVILSPVGAA